MVVAPDREAGALKEAADASTRSGKFHDALQLYSQALDRANDTELRSTLLANKCLALLNTGQRPEEALRDAESCLELRPRWPKAHLRAAQCHEALGDVPAAVAAYRRALELEPGLEEVVGKALAALELKGSRSHCRMRLAGGAAVYGMALHPKALNLGALSTKILVTACGDGLVRLWCSRTGTLLQALPGHADLVTTVEWSPCGLLLASGSLDGTARLWQLAPPDVHAPAPSMAWGEQEQGQQGAGQKGEGQQAGAQGQGAMPGLLRLRAELRGHTGRVSSLAFSTATARLPHSTPSAQNEGNASAAPGRNAAAAAAGATDTHGVGGSSEGLGDYSSSRGLGPAGSRAGEGIFLATGSTDCTARLWSVEDGTCLQVLKGHGGIITAISLSPCGTLLAIASGDTRCKVWETATGTCLHDIAWESGGVNLCGFLPRVPSQASSNPPAGASQVPRPPRPPMLLSCHIEPRRREGRVLLWDVGLEEELEEGQDEGRRAAGTVGGVEAAPQKPGEGVGGSGSEVPAFMGLAVAGLGGAAGTAGALAARGAAAEAGAQGAKIKAGAAQAPSMASSRAGLPASRSEAAGAWAGSEKGSGGSRARAGVGGRKRVGWVDGKLHAPALTIDGFGGKVTSWDACITSEGNLLLATACGDGLARLYDITDGAVPLFEVSMEHSMHSAAQHDMPTWSAASMQAAVNARNLVRFSPGGRLLAVSGGDFRLGIYEVEGGEAVQTLLGHSSSIRALLWAGPGDLVSGGEDGAVNFWRVTAEQ